MIEIDVINGKKRPTREVVLHLLKIGIVFESQTSKRQNKAPTSEVSSGIESHQSSKSDEFGKLRYIRKENCLIFFALKMFNEEHKKSNHIKRTQYNNQTMSSNHQIKSCVTT